MKSSPKNFHHLSGMKALLLLGLSLLVVASPLGVGGTMKKWHHLDGSCGSRNLSSCTQGCPFPLGMNSSLLAAGTLPRFCESAILDTLVCLLCLERSYPRMERSYPRMNEPSNIRVERATFEPMQSLVTKCHLTVLQDIPDHRIIDMFELERILKGHRLQPSCNEQGRPQLHRVAQSPIQPDLECLQRWDSYLCGMYPTDPHSSQAGFCKRNNSATSKSLQVVWTCIRSCFSEVTMLYYEET